MIELNLSKEKGIGSLNLQKGISLNLTKDNPLEVIKIGLGWQTRMDLDAIAVLMNGNKRESTIYFGNKGNDSIFLDGDDLTGGGLGDNETITAYLNHISTDVKKISLFANIFSFIKGDKTFKTVENSYIRLIDAKTDKELCKYSLEDDFSEFNAVHFADLIRDEFNDWKFITIGKGLNASVHDINKYCETGEVPIKKKSIFSKIFK